MSTTPDPITQFADFCAHPWTDLGGYTLACYLSDGERICPKCARNNAQQIVTSTNQGAKDGWAFGAVAVHWEGPPENCVQCNVEMPSEYGDPNAHDDERTPDELTETTDR